MKKKIIVLCMTLSMAAGSTSFAMAAEKSLPCPDAPEAGRFFEKIIEMLHKGWNDKEEPGNNQENSPYASEVVSLTNTERSKAGLPALKSDPALSRVAQKKAEDMAENGYFSHTSPTYGSAFDMLKAAGISYTSAGENIAKGQSSPQAVMSGWMNSSGHKANILGANYTHIGVGVAADKNGTRHWVQIFKG